MQMKIVRRPDDDVNKPKRCTCVMLLYYLPDRTMSTLFRTPSAMARGSKVGSPNTIQKEIVTSII